MIEQELLTNCFITNIFFRKLHLTPETRRIMLVFDFTHSYVMPLAVLTAVLLGSEISSMRD